MTPFVLPDLNRRWEWRAGCRGLASSIFFPPPVRGKLETPQPVEWMKAKRICYRCPVWLECQRDSMGERDGVWGGLDPKERKKIRREHDREVMSMSRKDRYTIAQFVAKVRQDHLWSEVSRIVGLGVGVLMELGDLAKLGPGEEDAADYKPTRPPVNRRIPMTTVRRIIEMRNAGLSQREIAKVLHTTTATVRKYLEAEDPSLISPKAMLNWPDEAPSASHADGWVKHAGRVMSAAYRGETEDGQWISMKVHVARGSGTVGWFRKDDVQLTRKNVAKVVMVRSDENRSRIYGSTA